MVAVAGPERVSFSGHTSVEVVELPVRIINPQNGEPVRGLKAENFQILEDGLPQKLSNFYEYDAAAEPVVTGEGSIPGAQHFRQSIYFFDLYLMETKDRDRAIDALRRQYEDGTSPEELVSIASFDGEMHMHLDAGRNPKEISEALDELANIKAHGIAQRIAFTKALTTTTVSGERKLDYYERRQRSREFMTELERRVERVGSALQAAIGRFALLEGQKILVVFSPGQPETSWTPSYSPIDFMNGEAKYPVQDLWHQLALKAADAGFTLYVVDSSGLRSSSGREASSGLDAGVDSFGLSTGQSNLPQTQALNNASADSGSTQAPQNLGQWLERTRKTLLLSSSKLTGGDSIFSTRIQEALSEIQFQWRHWYSLGYSLDHKFPGKERKIEIRLPGHPEYRVEYRKAYVDRTETEKDAEKMRSAMLFGADANPLGIRVEYGEATRHFHLGAAGAKRVKVPIVIQIPLGRLDFLPQGDIYSAKVLLSFFGKDEKGNESRLAREEQSIQVAADRMEEARRGGYFTYRMTLEVEGGKQSIFIGVKDELSMKTSIIGHDFE